MSNIDDIRIPLNVDTTGLEEALRRLSESMRQLAWDHGDFQGRYTVEPARSIGGQWLSSVSEGASWASEPTLFDEESEDPCDCEECRQQREDSYPSLPDNDDDWME